MTITSNPLWRDRNFVVFWLGQALSVFGDGFTAIALPLLVLRLTGSIVQMGAVSATMAAARIAGSVVAGIVADRWERRSVMLLCDCVRALLLGLVPLMAVVPSLSMPFLLVCVAVGSFAGSVFHVACFAALPALVGRERIVEVNSWLWGTYALMQIVGPLLGGLACSYFGPFLGIGVDAISFLLSAISIALVKFQKTESPISVTHAPASKAEFRLRSLLSGATFIWRTPLLRAMALSLAAVTFLTGSHKDLLIYQLEHDAHADASRIGMVLGFGSVGAIVSGVLAPRIYAAWGIARTWLVMSILATLPLCALGMVGSTDGTAIIAALLAVMAFGETVRGITSQSLRHTLTPDTMLGRVTSAYWAMVDLPSVLGSLGMTALAGHFGTSMVFQVSGAAALTAAILSWTVLRKMKTNVPLHAGD